MVVVGVADPIAAEVASLSCDLVAMYVQVGEATVEAEAGIEVGLEAGIVAGIADENEVEAEVIADK